MIPRTYSCHRWVDTGGWTLLALQEASWVFKLYNDDKQAQTPVTLLVWITLLIIVDKRKRPTKAT